MPEIDSIIAVAVICFCSDPAAEAGRITDIGLLFFYITSIQCPRNLFALDFNPHVWHSIAPVSISFSNYISMSFSTILAYPCLSHGTNQI